VSFQQAYDDHSGAVHAMVSRLSGHSCADDITQEVFLWLWRHPERFDPSRGTMRTLLLTVARTMTIDNFRSDDARRRREAKHRHVWPVREPVLDDVLLVAERRRSMRDAVDRLPPGERDAIAAAYYGGCTYRAAAVVLGVCEGTVKSRIRRGLQRLHQSLSGQAV